MDLGKSANQLGLAMKVIDIDEKSFDDEFLTFKWKNKIANDCCDIVKSEGKVDPTLFVVFKNEGQYCLGVLEFGALFEATNDKDMIGSLLRQVTTQLNAVQSLIVMESWAVIYKKKNSDGLEFLPPSMHPRRKEVVFFNMEVKGETGFSAQAFIEHDEEDNILIEAPDEWKENKESISGRFSNILSNK